MHNSRLVELLKTFSDAEIKKFGDFVRSPYFNKSDRVIKLYDQLKKYHPNYSSPLISKERIYGRLFPGKKYHDSTLRVVIHLLGEIAEKFITQKRFESNEPEYNFIKAIDLIDRKQYRLSEKIINDSLEKLERSAVRNDSYFYFKYMFEYERFFSMTEIYAGVYDKFLHRVNFEDMMNNFTSFYLLKILKDCRTVLHLNRNYNMNFNESAFRNIISEIDISSYSRSPAIEIYYYIFKMAIDVDDETNYFVVKGLLSKIDKKIFDYGELANIYIQLGNFCVRKCTKGKYEFENERFYIYKEEILHKTYLMHAGYMSPKFYVNAVRSGLLLDEFEWVKSFINDHKKKLEKSMQNEMFDFCTALYCFYVKDFEKSLAVQSMIKPSSHYMKISIKVFQIMALFEMNLDEQVLASLDSFRHFLTGNKLVPEKNIYLGFIKFVNAFIRLKTNKVPRKIKLLKETINNAVASEKRWLLKKINQLEKGK